MMPSITVPFLLVVIACVASASHRAEWASIFKEGASEAAEWAGLGHQAAKEKHGIVTFKHFVPPSKARDFVDKWNQYVGGPASKASGNIMIHLDQPAATNAFIYGYSEWDSWEALHKFVEGKDNAAFVKFAADNDVKWEWTALTEVGTVEPKMSQPTKKEGKAWKVLGEVIVKPHLGSEFVKVWSDAAESVKEENGNLVYALRRAASDNFRFWIYSSWESEEAWKDHLKTDGFKDLAEWGIKNDVIILDTPLISLDKY